jgi:hypothetical protein
MSKPSNDFSRFTKADQPAKYRIIANSVGEVGTLKTSFWLSAPGPIVVLSFDKGTDGVVQEFQETKDIYLKEYTWNNGISNRPDQQAAIDLVEEFIEDFEHAINLPNVRTVFIDKETELWDVVKYAEFGPPQSGTPKDWDAPKGLMRRMLNAPKALDINFGVIQGMRNEWVTQVNPQNGKKGITQSGNRIPAGSDDVDAIMNVNLEHIREDGEFKIRIGKMRGPGARALQYTTIPAVTFSELGQLMFEESTEEDWL